MPRAMIDPVLYDELQAHIRMIDEDRSLDEQQNFVAREDARRVLERQVVGVLERLIDDADKGERKRLRAVKRAALHVKSRLEQTNELLFEAFRTGIKSAVFTPNELLERFSGYIDRSQVEEWGDPPRYDQLDTFVDGVLRIDVLPREQREPDPEMVLYQPTPARIVVDLLQRLRLGPDDVFYDLGSGVGRVTILVALLSDARARGVEYETAYADYAQRRVKDLELPRSTFINADARDVNYADGTVFFLYTPFKGKILQRVLALLRHEARNRRIRVCTYGPGTFELIEEGGFTCVDEFAPDIHRVAIFERG